LALQAPLEHKAPQGQLGLRAIQALPERLGQLVIQALRATLDRKVILDQQALKATKEFKALQGLPEISDLLVQREILVQLGLLVQQAQTDQQVLLVPKEI
jgi:hypothetical protein